MPITIQMILIIITSLMIKFSCIPVTVARYCLRSPVCPYSEFGIPEPVRIMILL